MCQQYDAPGPVINTCNSFYCDQFTPNSPTKPKMWIENWPGWFKIFGGRDPHRPPKDVAIAVARFFQKGGSVQNYYMVDKAYNKRIATLRQKFDTIGRWKEYKEMTFRTISVLQ